MHVKICGITRPADAVAAAAAGANAIGLMFVPQSPRLIGIEQAREIIAAIGPMVMTVGVFRNAPVEQVLDTARELRLGAVQLQGQEDASYVSAVRAVVPVVRAVSFTRELSRERLEGAAADAVLLDGLRPGSGEAFDWSEAAYLRGLPRLILAGGLHSGNVAAGIQALRPYGVDVSSGVEESPGIKDARLMQSFVAAARLAVPEPV